MVIEERRVILVKEGDAFQISPEQEGQLTIPELKSNQEETDSRVILYCNYAAKQGYQNARVRTPDSDIFWILLCHARNIATTILFDTGHGSKKSLINITRLSHHYTQDMCEPILGLAGCDSVSSFKGIGKLKPLKLLLKSPTYCDSLRGLGHDWRVDDDLLDGCEKFICSVYGSI